MRVHGSHIHIWPRGHAEARALDAIAPVTHAHISSKLLHDEERTNGRGGITKKRKEQNETKRENRETEG